jgi:hypothetical protein
MKHYDDIEKDMNNTLKINKLDNMPMPNTPNSTDSVTLENSIESISSGEKSSPGKKKSTITATKSICKHNVKIIVSFD